MGITSNEINFSIMTLLEQAIEQDGVYNIFVQSGTKNPEGPVVYGTSEKNNT